MKTMTPICKTLSLAAAAGLTACLFAPAARGGVTGTITASTTGIHFHIDVDLPEFGAYPGSPFLSQIDDYIFLLTASEQDFFGNIAADCSDMAGFNLTGPTVAIGGVIVDGESHREFIVLRMTADVPFNSGVNFSMDFEAPWLDPDFDPNSLAGAEFGVDLGVKSIGSSFYQFFSTEPAIPVTVVPEPSTYALLGGVGAVALAVLMRRRQRRQG